MKQLVVESFKQNSNSEAANKLMQYENFTHNTNEIIDKAFLNGLKLAQQELLKNKPQNISYTKDIIGEANVVLESETNAVELTGVTKQLALDFTAELEDQYTTITEFWDTTIQPGFSGPKTTAMLEALKANKIVSLEDLIDLYNNPITQWKSEEEMLEDIKKCNF
jgi:hypothetical protein